MRAIPLCLIAALVATAAPAAAQVVVGQSSCRTVLTKGGARTSCVRVDYTPPPPPKPVEPFRRGPGSVEVVKVDPPRRPASVTSAAPIRRTEPNFCGDGFRMLRDGSCVPR